MNATFRVGKAKIRLEAEGCVDCGSRYSTTWTEAEKVEVQVPGRGWHKRGRFTITLYRCADCQASVPRSA